MEKEKAVPSFKQKETIGGCVILIILALTVLFLLKQFIGFINSEPAPRSNTEGQVIETTADAEAILPKISFEGNIEPLVARKGEKVVITFKVKNEDSEQTIEGMRILFSSDDFIDSGLNVVNVMSGGVQNGRAFEWLLEGTKIPPQEERSFVIVAEANEIGSYETVIGLKSPSGLNEFDDQEKELKAKLTVY